MQRVAEKPPFYAQARIWKFAVSQHMNRAANGEDESSLFD